MPRKSPGLSEAMNATAPRTPSKEEFIEGARAEPVDSEDLPWSQYETKAVPRTGLNLRLNDHQLGKIRWLSERREISQQQLIKRLLMPEIDKCIEEELKG